MPFASQFNNFDPLSGSIPSWPFRKLPQIGNRARALFSTRTAEQIECVAISADWMIEDYFCNVKKDEEIKRLRTLVEDSQCGQIPPNYECEEALRFFEVEETGHIHFIPEMETELLDCIAENLGEVEALKKCIGRYDLADDPWCPDANEYEYFAVLSVWLVADTMKWLEWPQDRQQLEERLSAITSFKVPDETNPWFQMLQKQMDQFKHEIPEIARIYEPVRKVIADEKHWLSMGADTAFRAMDAVCFAEHLKEVSESVAEAVEAKQKIKMDTLERKRHSKDREVREDVVKHWVKNPSRWSSVIQAASYFEDWTQKRGYTPEKGYTTYQRSTFVRWIRQHAKQLGIRLR